MLGTGADRQWARDLVRALRSVSGALWVPRRCSWFGGKVELAVVAAGEPCGALGAAGQERWRGGMLQRENTLVRRSSDFRGADRGLGQGSLFADPAGQQSFGVVVDPLVEQGSDLAAQVGCVVQARELETLKRCNRCVAEEIPRWLGSRVGAHGPWVPVAVPYET